MVLVGWWNDEKKQSLSPRQKSYINRRLTELFSVYTISQQLI